MQINIDYIARVEGEGSVKFDIRDGKLQSLKLNIWEPPRFFEGFLKGKELRRGAGHHRPDLRHLPGLAYGHGHPRDRKGDRVHAVARRS